MTERKSPFLAGRVQSGLNRLQEAGVLPKDTMGGHYLPSRLNPAERKLIVDESQQAASEAADLIYPEDISPKAMLQVIRMLKDPKQTIDSINEFIQSQTSEIVFGTDISHWQGPLTPEWFEQAKQEGIKFVYIKLIGGSYDPYWEDPEALENIQKAHDAGLLVGGYIFMNPTYEAKDQVDAAITFVGDKIGLLKAGVAFDLEITNGKSGSQLKTNMEEGVVHANSIQEIVVVPFYTSAGFADPLTGFNLNNVKNDINPWPASWKTGDQPTMPLIFANLDWKTWQFSGGMPVAGKNVDGDKMPIAEFVRLTEGNGDIPPPEPIVVEDEINVPGYRVVRRQEFHPEENN